MTTDDADAFRTELDGLHRFRKQQNTLSFLAFFVAIAIFATGTFFSSQGRNPLTALPFLVTSSALYVFAFMSYCRYKGRSVVWAFSCGIGCLGLLLLLVLQDSHYQRILDLERALRRQPATLE